MWEYWVGKEWWSLYLWDGIYNFVGCGFIEFMVLKVYCKLWCYGDNLYWIRVCLEMGGYDEVLVCDCIFLNFVYVLNYIIIVVVILGSS